VTRIFFAYRDSPQRRHALAAELGSPERYVLFGADELRARGHEIRHNLERPTSPGWARALGPTVKRGLELAGGYGGDFATVLASLREANRADVVLSTVDTVGIPLMLLRRAGRLRPPLVYTAIGLPERLTQLRSARMRRLYAVALARCSALLAYSAQEADDIGGWLREQGQQRSVLFVPFGVDVGAFQPGDRPPSRDVVSVGADPHRDYGLLLEVASSLPSATFTVVMTGEHARALLARIPPNMTVEVDLPFDEMRRRLREARVVALPVRENSYSGATTVLLQAMALGKPVVVSRTRAIADGYGLVDGENCRLVHPGDAAGFSKSVAHVLRDDLHARALGSTARMTVERTLTWDRYVGRIEAAITASRQSA
jgi:glycosyltransferase involved in cell wall biosynthesis